MAAIGIPLAMSGISALAGLFGNRQKKQTMEQTQTEDLNRLTAPEYDPKTGLMRDTLMNYYLDRLGSDEDFFGGYRKQGIGQINQGSNMANEQIQSMLASKGLLGTTAGASAFTSNLLNRYNQGNSFLNSIPMLQDQRRAANLKDATGFFAGLPVGQRVTGQSTTRSTSTGTGGGNMLGGSLASLGTTLGGLYGQGAFSPTRKPIVPGPSYGYDPYGDEG